MSASDLITPEAVLTLLTPAIERLSNLQVQVISVDESYAQGGCKKIMLTVSDGDRLLRCGVLPKLFHQIESRTVSMYSIVRINQVLLSEICCLNMVIITEMDPVSQLDDVIGVPSFGSNDN
jgi:hypothetical protein